jgi:RHS repeat-associated protein
MKKLLLSYGHRMAFFGVLIGALDFGVVASHAQGIGFQLSSVTPSVVLGQSISGSVSIVAVNDYYDAYSYSDQYGDQYTARGFYTDWFVHSAYEVPSEVAVSGSGISTVYQEVLWPANNYGTENFSVTLPNYGSPGYDFTATVSVDNSDPYANDPYDTNIDANPFDIFPEYEYCDTAYYSANSASVTVINPNTVMAVEINGSDQLTESETPQTTDIRIYRADTYNTRTVYYTISGDAIDGNDYTADLSGSVTLYAGSEYVDIPVSTLNNIAYSKTLTITLNYDSIGSYQIGTDNSATITFLPYTANNPNDTTSSDDPNTGGAQTFMTAASSIINSAVSQQKGNSLTATNAPVNLPFAFMNVQAVSPYATAAGPTAGLFMITRSGGTNAFTLNYTVTGTAVAGSNYVALPGSVRFATNQTSTNLSVYVLTNAPPTSAQSVVLTLSAGSNYFLGYNPQAIVTLLPNGSLTNSVASPSGRYWRGSGSDPTFWSQIIPLDYESGTVYSNLNGNGSTLYPGLSSGTWSIQTLYHYNATNSLPQTNPANRIPFNNPVVAFGERTGGTPLYYGQPYNFGIYAGDPLPTANQIVIQAYYRNAFSITTNLTLSTNITWSASTIPDNSWTGIAYGNGIFAAISSTGGNNEAHSTNGVNWTLSSMPSADAWQSITYGGGKFVAVSLESSSAAYSANGINWTATTLPAWNYWQSVAYGNGKFVAIAYNPPLLAEASSTNTAYSTNGISWSPSMLPAAAFWTSVTYGNGTFVAIGGQTNGAYSTDGVNWMASTLPPGNWESVAYGDGVFTAVAFDETNSAYSTDGINWTASTPLPYAANWQDVTYGNGIFAAVANGTNAAYSMDGINWVSLALPDSADWDCATYGNGTFAAVAYDSTTAAHAFFYTTNYSYVTNYQLAGTISLHPPNYFNTNSMATYVTNGFQVTSNAFGLSTTLSDSPGLNWGATSLGAYTLTHTATAAASNYFYVVEVSAYPAAGTNAMVISASGAVAPSLLYTLEFEARPPWRSQFLDQPQFAGSPLPPYYAGKTLAEMLTNTPPVTNVVNFAPSAATNLDDSPELQRHPILDNFVASMGNDPIALANYVINNIDLTDPMDYSDSGNIADQAINSGGVSRGALGTFMEKQGSAMDQCALLVYLLRQAGVPAVYEFAPPNGLQILDARLSQMLKFQVQGAASEAGQLYTTNTMIAVNYPWVAAYIGTNWVHIFPWLKDYEITEGLNLWEEMPSNYPSAYQWVRDYIYGNANLLAFTTNGDNTPRVIFPAYLNQMLLQNHPGISVDDIGVQILNRQHYYSRWQDFPTPTWVTNVSTPLESLTSSGITNISPTLTNIFDTVSVEIYSVTNPTNNLQTGSLRLVDLHNREFYVNQIINPANTNQVLLSLILVPFRTNVTTQLAFTNDPTLLSREVLTMTLGASENQLGVRFQYLRHQALGPSYPIDPSIAFLGFDGSEEINLERPLWKGDQAAICMDYGRVTEDMLNVHETAIWQMENAVQLNPSLTNSMSPDIYEGEVMYLAGMSYYKKVSDFNQVNENLNKVNLLSCWAAGLSKISAARDSFGNFTNGIVPVLPNVDMFFYDAAYVGNGTVQPDSGVPFQLAQQNFNLLSIINNSAEEHQIINQFYQQTNAVSTVRLLQLSQSSGSGIVPLNFNNYAAQGATVYQGLALQNWDVGLWSQVAGALQNSPYTIAYITPGPMTNSAYAGMGALILGWSQWQALISPESLNGAWGGYLQNNAIGNVLAYSLSGDASPTIALTAAPSDTQLAPTTASSFYYDQLLTGIQTGQYVLSPFDTAWTSQGASIFGTSLSGTSAQNFAAVYSDYQTLGNFGPLDNGGNDWFDTIMDPVHTITGEFYVSETDLQLPGPLPLALHRNYSSQNLADNQFGTGWKLNIMPYLVVAVGGTNIYAADMDGAVLAYVRTNSSVNVWVPTLAANPLLANNSSAGVGGLFNRLRDRIVQTVSSSTTNYTLYAADGSTRLFQVVSFNNGILNQTRPYLQNWTDSRGNYYTFTYGTNSSEPDFGQMTRIQSSNGNYLGFDYDVNAHIIDAYCGDDRRLTYTYDQYGDLIGVTLPDNTTRSYTYQHATQSVTNGTATYSTHLIIEEDKPDGRALQNAYDSQRRVTNQMSTAGSSLTPIRTATFVFLNNFAYTNSYTNRISGHTLIIDGNGHTNRYDYTNSLITKITDPLGQTIQQTWYPDATNAPGYPRSLLQLVDKRGMTNQFEYDANGNVTNTITFGDLTGNGIPTQTATNTAVYNSNSLPVQLTDPVGNGKLIVYDPVFNFLPQQIVYSAAGVPVSTNFTLYGNATNVVINGSMTVTNLAFGLPVRQIRAYGSPDAATNDFAYGGNGFLTQTIRYSGNADPNVTNTFYYNERGQMVNRMDALGADTFFDYDAFNRPIEQENFDELGNVLSWNFNYYNDNGELNWTEGPRYNPENYEYYDYDGAGRVTTEIHWRSEANSVGTGVESPAGYNLYAQTFYQYDPLGNLLLKVDPRGAMTTNTWDALCRLVRRTHIDTNGITVLSTEGFGYEPGGEVRYYTNALGGLATNLYTITGKPEFRRNPDGSTNAWRYLLDGRIYQEIQGNGAYWQTTYNDASRIVTRTFYSAAGAPEATNSVQFDRRGNVIQRMDEGGNVFTTAFDGLDRAKVVAGPAIVTVSSYMSGGLPGGPLTYVTNILQEISTNFYDAAGRTQTNVNVLGETTVTTKDALGRITGSQIFSSAGSLVREQYFAYSADHNSVTVTDGSGPAAISHTTWTDTDGHPVLSIANPASGVNDFTLNQYDLAGNLVSVQHDSSSNGAVTTWTTTSLAYDGLNRLTQKVDRDNAITTYAYDALNDLTNRVMPGGNLAWAASYNSAGQMLQERNISGSSGTRTNTYAYFSSGNPFAGLLQTKTDGRGVTCTNVYNDRLWITTNAYAGSLPQQNLTTIWQYDPRGYVTNITEQFASTNTGPTTSVQRKFDPYGLLSSENVNDGTFAYGASQNWDADAHRTQLGIGSNSYGFAWQADGRLMGASDSTGSAGYTYDTAGILTSRQAGNRLTSISSRDGEGRPLSISTTLNLYQSLVNETLVWSGDGLLTSDTLNRSDFTDSRSYAYASLSRRLTQEQLNLNATAAWTNSFAYDNGVPAGPGVLTSAGQAAQGSALWSAISGPFARVAVSTNTVNTYTAYGHVNGQSTLTAWLDNQPVTVTGIGTNAMEWQASMELSQGAHQLTIAALHPSGFFTAWATNTFTNSLAYQAATDTYDNAGNITNRVWKNPSGTVARTQTLSWDARGRLHTVTQRDANNSGYNWTAIYDGLNRRLSTTSILVTNGVPYATSPTIINSYFDPQVEFLELGVTYGITTEWKLYGPDLNGVYGGMNGTGGFEAVTPYLNWFEPTVSDIRGNILGVITNGTMEWNPARPTGFGAVPGYRPPALDSGASISLSSAWRGRWVDITGYYSVGLRPYDPVSGRWLTYDSVFDESDPNGFSAFGGDPINGFDSDGRCVEGAATATGNLLYGTASLANNALCSLSYAVASPFAPDWAYQTYGGNVQNFANTVTGTAQFGYNVAATATYGAISPFAPNFAYNNYGGNVQQFMGQAPALYGGNNQSTAYQFGYGAVTLASMLMGGEESDAGNLGTVSQTATAASSVWDLNPFARGQAIEQTLGANLPGNFPTIDTFDSASGTATSIKSIDLNAASYQNTATLTSRLNGYVNSVAGFNGANWAGVSIDSSEITARQLQLAIPPGSASAAQQAAINAAAARAQTMGVNFITTPVP